MNAAVLKLEWPFFVRKLLCSKNNKAKQRYRRSSKECPRRSKLALR
jgi:hypothetical protein